MQRNDLAIQVCVERETKARSGMYGKVITKALMSKGTVKFLITAKRVLRRPKRECRGHLKPELSNQKVSSKQNVGNGAKERTKSYWRVEEAAKHSSRSACGVQDIQDNAVVCSGSSSNTPRTSASSSGKRQESVLWIADNKERAADRGPWGRLYRLTSQLVSAHKNCGTPVCRVCSTGCGFICYVGVGGCGRGRRGASDQHGARISDCSIPRIRTRTRTRRSQYSTVQYFLISFFSHFSS